jgi:hypothetical protein
VKEWVHAAEDSSGVGDCPVLYMSDRCAPGLE